MLLRFGMKILGAAPVLATLMLGMAATVAAQPGAPGFSERDFLSRVRRLTVEGKRAGEGYWSPDGKRLVFQSEREPGNPFYQIYVVDLANGDVKRISPGSGKTTCAYFRPGSDEILFASTHADPRSLQLQQEELEFRASGKQRRYAWDYDAEMDLYAYSEKTGALNTDIKNVTIWGNHSSTQYPDVHHASVKGKPALEQIDQAWYEGTFIPTVQQRGAAIIKARGASSAASAASAAIDHMRNWALGTSEGDWVSMGIPSDGSYGISPGVIYGYPVTCRNGAYEIVKGIDVTDFSRARMQATLKELHEERDAIKHLLG